jgi:hypothetical protein
MRIQAIGGEMAGLLWKRCKARWFFAAVAGCVGLLFVVSPAFASDEHKAVDTPWVTTGNSLSSGFLGTLNKFPLVVKTNNAERLRVTAGGSVGIGTANPASRLSVKTATGTYGFTQTDGVATVGTWVGIGGSADESGWLGTKSDHPLQFFVNNGPTRMTIDLTGNVGVGTTDPTEKLTVKTAPGSYGVSHTDGTATVGTWVGPGATVDESGWLGTKTDHPLQLFTNDGPPRLTVGTDGNVGVGTTAPATKLAVQTATKSYGVTHTDGTATIGTWVGAGATVGESGWLGT